MASINKVILVGNCGKDPEMRYLDSGIAVASLTLATTEKGYKLQNGTEVPEKTEWHNIVAWRGLAEVAEKYIKKGSQLYVEGKIQTQTWEKDGVTHYRVQIVAEVIQMLGSKPKAEGYNPEETTYTGKPAEPAPSRAGQKSDFPTSDGSDGSDDLPF